ncbi:MAG: hypothetical protein QW525_03120 [Thermoplasmatales archaeon]
MMINEKVEIALEKVSGVSLQYKAYEEVNTILNGLYCIKIISEQNSGLLIINHQLLSQKKKIKHEHQVIDYDLVYPLIRGKEVKI